MKRQYDKSSYNRILILVENEGRDLDELFLRVKRKIRRGDALVFDIYLKNCEPLLYRIKIK